MLSLVFGNYLVLSHLSRRWGSGARLVLAAPFVFLAVCFTWPLFLLGFPIWLVLKIFGNGEPQSAPFVVPPSDAGR